MLGLSKSEKRLKELEEIVAKLTRLVESRDLDWADMRARCKRLLDRAEKAAARAEQGVDSEHQSTAPLGGEGAAASNGSVLTPAQAILQAKIMSRRRLTS